MPDDPLVALATSGSELQKVNAGAALGALAFNGDNQVAIAKAGGIAPLVALATLGSEKEKDVAAAALEALARESDENTRLIRRAGYSAPLSTSKK